MRKFNLGIIKVKFEADTKGLEEGTEKAKTGTEGAARGIQLAMGGLVVGAFLKAGQAAVQFAQEALAETQAFEKGMKEVFTLLPGMTSSAYGKMERDALNFGAQVGRQSDEVVPALYQAISEGVPQGNVFDFMQVASDAALGGVTDLETAVDGITSVVNAYGADTINAQQASDLLFTAVKGGKTNFEQLSNSMFNVIPTAASLGVEFGNVTAAMAAITAQGTPTSVATTQLRGMLVELSNSSKKAAQTFERIAGKSFKEFLAEGNNVQDALQLMEVHANETGVGINELFSRVEAGNAALALTGQGTEKFSAELLAAENAAGATSTAAQTMAESLQFTEDKAAAATERFMILVGDALAPTKQEALELKTTLVTLAGDLLQMGAGAEDAANDLIAASEAEQDFTDVGHKLSKLAGEFKAEGGLSGFIGVNALRDDLQEATIKSIDFSKSNEEINTSLKEVFGSSAELKNGLVTVNGVLVGSKSVLGQLNEEYRDTIQVQELSAAAAAAASYDTLFLAEAETELAQTAEMVAEAEAAANEEIIAAAKARADAAGVNGEFADKVAQTNSRLTEGEAVVRAANAANKEHFATLKAQAAAEEEAAAAAAKHAAQMGDYFNAALNASEGAGFFNESLDELGTHYVEVGGLTADQRESLGELQGEYDKITDSIRSYQSGLEGVGLSEEERSAKITEQQEKLAELDAAMQPLVATTGELSERNVEATINQDAVNQAIFDAANASGASAVQLALLGGELGIYSEAALEAALKSALIQEKIDALAGAYVDGTVSVSDMRGELATFMEGLDGTAASMVGTAKNADSLTGSMNNTSASIAGASSSASGLKGSLDSIPREINVKVNISQSGSVPSLPGKGQGGAQNAAFSTGGFTGGLENEFAGSVHGQEFVFSAPSVRSIGLGNLESLHQSGKTGVINNNQSSSHGGNTVNVYLQGNSNDPDVGYEVGETVQDHLRQMGVEA